MYGDQEKLDRNEIPEDAKYSMRRVYNLFLAGNAGLFLIAIFYIVWSLFLLGNYSNIHKKVEDWRNWMHETVDFDGENQVKDFFVNHSHRSILTAKKVIVMRAMHQDISDNLLDKKIKKGLKVSLLPEINDNKDPSGFKLQIKEHD